MKNHSSWEPFFEIERKKDYYHELQEKVKLAYETDDVYPALKDVFRAYDITPLDKIKVVIIGQDPYHNGQATGLAFSVREGDKLPASLRNIFKELESDLGIKRTNGDLTDWAEQGIFLLNTALTVVAHQPASHAKIGWSTFIENTISYLSEKRPDIIWVLWGKHAQSYEHLISGKVIKSAHPSPFSANRGFFGSKPFSQINNTLIVQEKSPIKYS
ncbi:uracil-DNA glycosylase [Floricoccus penangensis]|uniref:uracil-DNA glycosylase n=1 Tax=Floricoccus penangensis TaxID=1859475 RepID=UPI00203C65C2|nr:uracil-DNA glycosylase [Floricoccus penangensis]URZ86760.1 uracil-DNA glycosylase [Floricoccus penangensis]